MTEQKPEPGTFSEAEHRAAWELVVYLRTVIPQLDLDVLAAKVQEVAPWVGQRWPTLAAAVADIIDGLRTDAESPMHRLWMEALADELEAQLGTGLGWPKPDHD